MQTLTTGGKDSLYPKIHDYMTNHASADYFLVISYMLTASVPANHEHCLYVREPPPYVLTIRVITMHPITFLLTTLCSHSVLFQGSNSLSFCAEAIKRVSMGFD